MSNTSDVCGDCTTPVTGVEAWGPDTRLPVHSAHSSAPVMRVLAQLTAISAPQMRIHTAANVGKYAHTRYVYVSMRTRSNTEPTKWHWVSWVRSQGANPIPWYGQRQCCRLNSGKWLLPLLLETRNVIPAKTTQITYNRLHVHHHNKSASDRGMGHCACWVYGSLNRHSAS